MPLTRTPLENSFQHLNNQDFIKLNNLSGGIFNIYFGDLSNHVNKILIYNTFVQIVKIVDKNLINSSTLQLDLFGYPTGIYFINFKTNYNSFTEKLLISN